jgi:hypothetical protein
LYESQKTNDIFPSCFDSSANSVSMGWKRQESQFNDCWRGCWVAVRSFWNISNLFFCLWERSASPWNHLFRMLQTFFLISLDWFDGVIDSCEESQLIWTWFILSGFSHIFLNRQNQITSTVNFCKIVLSNPVCVFSCIF